MRKIQRFIIGMMLLLLIGVNAGIYLLFQAQATEAEVKRLEGKTESIVRAVNHSMGKEPKTQSTTALLRAYLPCRNGD